MSMQIYIYQLQKVLLIIYFEGIKYLEQRKFKQAEDSLKKASAKKANNATYYRELGAVFEQHNKLNRAELAYRKAIEVSPDWAEFYVLLGKVLVTKNNKKQQSVFTNRL